MPSGDFVVTFRLPAEDRAALDRLVRALGTDRSTLLRALIREKVEAAAGVERLKALVGGRAGASAVRPERG